MNIGYVAPDFPATRSSNGVTTYTDIMAREMVMLGHSVSVFCLSGASDSAGLDPGADGLIRVYPARQVCMRIPLLRVAYYRIGTKVLPTGIAARDLRRGLRQAIQTALRDGPIDVLECSEVRGIPSLIYSLGIPLVVRLHAPYAVTAPANGQHRGRLLHSIARAERRCLQGAQFISAPTRAVIGETEKALGLQLGDVRVIPNPVSAWDFAATVQQPANPRELLFVGRCDRIKGFDILVTAFCHLARDSAYTDVCLRIVGPLTTLHLNGRKSIAAEDFVTDVVTEPAIRSRIMMEGRLAHDQVSALRRRGSITVVPSRFENFAYTIVEAMAAGCPVVASDSGGTPEILQHGRNGLLFRSGDDRDLADRIRLLLDNPALARRLGMQAREDVQERYAPKLVARQTADFYRQVVSLSSACAKTAKHSRLRRLITLTTGQTR